MPLSIVALVAFVEVHVRVDDEPIYMLEGSALIATVGVCVVTFTVANDVVVPPGPVADRVYVVV